MKKIIIISAIAFLPAATSAATYFFDPIEKNVDVNSQFTIELKLDPEGEFINAIEGSIKFPKKLVRVVSIDSNDSIINAWILQPKESGNEIKFSGIIPGGFDGVRQPLEKRKLAGKMFSITFEALRNGNEAILVDDLVSLKNDEVGNEVVSSMIPMSLTIGDNYTPSSYKNIFTLVIILTIIFTFIYKKIL